MNAYTEIAVGGAALAVALAVVVVVLMVKGEVDSRRRRRAALAAFDARVEYLKNLPYEPDDDGVYLRYYESARNAFGSPVRYSDYDD